MKITLVNFTKFFVRSCTASTIAVYMHNVMAKTSLKNTIAKHSDLLHICCAWCAIL